MKAIKIKNKIFTIESEENIRKSIEKHICDNTPSLYGGNIKIIEHSPGFWKSTPNGKYSYVVPYVLEDWGDRTHESSRIRSYQIVDLLTYKDEDYDTLWNLIR